MFRIAQDRYSIIKDVNYLCSANGDLRFQRANSLIGEDATKSGFSIVVNGSNKDRQRKLKQGRTIKRLAPSADKVQKVLDDFLERTQLHILCTEHAKALLREGDLFLNVVVDLKSGLVLQIKRAPALTIKKNINEYGEFIDINRAYSQIDTSQIYQLYHSEPPEGSRVDFPIYQMNHIRWLADETQIYGTSQYAVSRKCYKMLEKMEESLAYRRIYRSVSKRSHKLDGVITPAQIEEYKRVNSMIDENGKPTKNAHMLTDYIGNVEVTALHDEAKLDEINDIELVENNLWINLLVPKAIITGGQSINRDILKVQYPHYLMTLESITDRLEYGDNSIYSGYRAIIDLELMLNGINPESISYDVVWSPKVYDSTVERVESIQNALGKNGGKQLISHEKAIQLVADDFDIEDPSIMYRKILEENQSNDREQQNNNGSKNKADYNDDKELKKNEFNDTIIELKSFTLKEIKVLNDELEADSQDMDKEIESFKDRWNSFFDVFYLLMLNTSIDIKNLDIDVVINKADKIFDNILNSKDVPKFYEDYVVNIGLKGSKTARKILNKLNFPKSHMGINMSLWKEDIHNDLLNLAGERIKGIKETTLKDIRKNLANGYDTNLGWKGIMKNLEPIIKDSVRAEMIAITELSWAYNRSILRVYSRSDVEYVQWSALHDMKTCDYCRSMHGKIYPINDCPDNPDHPRCRCTWLPVRKYTRRVA